MAAVTASVASMAGMVTVVFPFISFDFFFNSILEVFLKFVHHCWGFLVIIVAAVTGCVASMADMVTVIPLAFSSFFGIKLVHKVSFYMI